MCEREWRREKAVGIESLCTQMPKIKGVTQKLERSGEVTSVLMGWSPSETRQGFSVLSSCPRTAPRPAERHTHRFKENKALGASSRLHRQVTSLSTISLNGTGWGGGGGRGKEPSLLNSVELVEDAA